MALTRKYCEELGLTAEQMDSVLAEHGKSIAQAKSTASGEVESLKTEIESLKAANSDLMAEKEKIEKAAEKAKLDAAIDTELMKAGAHNPRAVHPFLDYDGVSFDKGGKLKGLDTQLESLAESEPYLFKTAEPEKKESAEAESESVLFVQPSGRRARKPCVMFEPEMRLCAPSETVSRYTLPSIATVALSIPSLSSVIASSRAFVCSMA